MKAEKSNKSKAEYWRYTEDSAELAKFDNIQLMSYTLGFIQG